MKKIVQQNDEPKKYLIVQRSLIHNKNKNFLCVDLLVWTPCDYTSLISLFIDLVPACP